MIFTQDETEAQFGSVEFRSETEPPVIARGKINEDGTFELTSSGRKGTIVGKHKVIVIQVVGNSRLTGQVVHHHGNDVDKKYSTYRTSDLVVDINEETAKDLVLMVDAQE